MPRLRVLRVQGTTPVSSDPRLRILRVQGSGTAAASPRLRVLRIQGSGTAAITLLPIEARTVEPGDEVVVTAVLTDGTAADSYAWRQVPPLNPVIAYTPADNDAFFTAPAIMDPVGASIILGVKATKDGATSPEVFAAIDVLPENEWTRVPGGEWEGASGGSSESVITEGDDIIVIVGQSNARGVADDFLPSDQYNGPEIRMWDQATNTIVPAVEPQSTPDGTAVGMGMSNTFIKQYAANRLQPGRRVLIVNTARGGTGFKPPSTNSLGTNMHWDRLLTNNADNLALRSLDILAAAKAAAGPGAKVVAVLANHGSNDGVNYGSSAQGKIDFKAKLQDFITWYRSQIGETSVPYMMMQMRPSLLLETRHKNMDDAQTETAAEMANVGKGVSPNGSQYNKNDSVHFNAAGMRVIGNDLYPRYVTLADTP